MNYEIVKKPEELILMKGDFSESALKLSAFLIANLKNDQINYKINVKDYLNKHDKKIKDYNYLYKVSEELMQKYFKMEDRFKKKFSMFNFVSNIDYYEGILEIDFSSKTLKYLLQIKDKYTKYNLFNIMKLNSKYAIRLYELLKNKFETNNTYNKKTIYKMELNELKNLLNIPKSYQYSSHIKKRILEKAQKDFLEHTDIVFSFEEKKQGRKVNKIIFYVEQNPKTRVAKTDKNYFKNRQTFVALLRKNYKGNQKMWGWVTFTEAEKKVNYYLGLNNKKYMYAYAPGYENKDFNKVESAKQYDLWLKIAQHSKTYQEILLKGLCILELTQKNDEKYIKLNNDIKEYFKQEENKKIKKDNLQNKLKTSFKKI